MKFKRILAILLVSIVAISVFAGCDVITKNEERDNNQALATISYRGLTSTVTKGDFYSSFNSLAYYYIYYYGYTVEETADAVLESLANRELLILYARTVIAEDLGLDVTVDIAQLMTPTMKNEAIKSTNESMQTQYDSLFTELWEEAYPDDEDETADDEDEDNDSDEETDTPRTSRPDMAEAKIDYDSPDAIADADKEVPFFEQADHYKDDYTTEQKNISDKAVVQLKKNLNDNYVSYEYYLTSAYETQLLEKFKRMMGKDYVLTNDTVKQAVADKYNQYITLNKEAFKFNTEANYSSALSTLSKLVYHPASEQGYGYVYNILLKFSDEQTAALNSYKTTHTDTTLINNYRNVLANEITVNVTNPDYDADAEAGEENSNMYSEKDVAVKEIIDRIFGEIAAATTFDEKREVATKWVYLVNDDPGMYDTENGNIITNNNLGYLIAPEGKSSNWVTEFTELGRALVSGSATTWTTVGSGLGAYGWCVTDYGIHIMFVSYIPYDATQIAAGTAENCIDLNYTVYYGRFGDDNDNNKTLEEAIFEMMKEAYISTEYSNKAQEAINANKADNIKKNDKLWKKIMKELDEAYNS